MKKKYWGRLFVLTTMLLFIASCGSKKEQTRYASSKYPKYEFRGAWIHTVTQAQYKSMNPTEMKQYFIKMLNDLQKAGINAVVFQVRPQADAFYNSQVEPWSHYLTGVQGQAPAGGFDPLAFMIEECHKRNMELHAWLNPYRVGSSSQTFVPNHVYKMYPERFIRYGQQVYFDPGYPENRYHICRVVKDIVSRYDVDAIHMDDYFYPYPAKGVVFDDDRSFNMYARQQGFSNNQRGDWRRNNVNMLIQDIKYTIAAEKPWVRFGISPFGIYRNKKSTADGSGSDTNGLQNYDDLYADIKLWVKKGWIDYNIPQIYWEMGHRLADYTTLIHWWNENNFKQPLYIGQDVRRTMDAKTPSGDNQLAEKMRLSRTLKNVDGNCFWPGYDLMGNYKGVTDELKANYHKYPALIPPYTHMHNRNPKEVTDLKEINGREYHYLQWESDARKDNPESAQYYVVYRFASDEKENLEDASSIVEITRNKFYILPSGKERGKFKYVVTAVDAFHNESKGKLKKVNL